MAWSRLIVGSLVAWALCLGLAYGLSIATVKQQVIRDLQSTQYSEVQR